jgi:O-antigen ligase
VAGGAVGYCVVAAISAPELPRATAALALLVAGVALWRPVVGLMLVLGIAPVGALLATGSARAAELFAWSFLAAWLLRLWGPLTTFRLPGAITIPVALYGLAAVASWLTMTIAGAAGVAAGALPEFLLRAIPPDFLVFSTAEPQTAAMLQTATGVAMFLAALAVARTDRGTLRPVAWVLVVSAAIVAVATLVDVARQWGEHDFGGWFLLRYARGERFSLHLRDLNAAGSLYVLSGLTALGLAMFDRTRRRQWLGLAAVMAPAMFLAGSRSSFVAAVAGLLILAAGYRGWNPTRRQLVIAAAALAITAAAAALAADWRTDVRGAAGRAVSLRSQFSQTTARMVASAPVFGVGVGRYFTRSSEFMPADLRELYGNENAHNYFAQQFAELGIIGGLLFLWLTAAIVARGWSAARAVGAYDAMTIALFAGIVGYLLTCVTGHPLLVSEAALPFWIVTGAVASAARDEVAIVTPPRVAVAAAAALFAVQVGLGARDYTHATETPRDRGFHEIEQAEDGTTFRWVTRHGVTYVADGPGFIRMRLRAPDLPVSRPLVLETSVAGRVVDRRPVPPDRWITYDIALRRAERVPFRRVDLRVNQEWTEEVRLGNRAARRPISVMVAEMAWIPLS